MMEISIILFLNPSLIKQIYAEFLFYFKIPPPGARHPVSWVTLRRIRRREKLVFKLVQKKLFLPTFNSTWSLETEKDIQQTPSRLMSGLIQII